MVYIAQDPQVALGRAVRLRREEVGLSQLDLAVQLEKGQGWISNIENGRTNLAYGTVDRIARALGWKLGQLVELAESVETQARRPLDKPLRSPPK